MAQGDTARASTYQAWYDQGRQSFESKLWNGSYYRIDSSSSSTNRVMRDQVCGHWYG